MGRGWSPSTVFTLCALLLVLTAAAEGQGRVDGLFEAVPAEHPVSSPGLASDFTSRSRPVRIHLDQLDFLPARAGGSLVVSAPLTLNLFDDVVLSGIVERIEPTYSGGHSISGRIAGVELGTMTLVVNGGALAGRVWTPDGTYRIRSAEDGTHVVSEIDPSRLPGEGRPLHPEEELSLNGAAATAPPSDVVQPATGLDRVDTGSTIDVAVFYTPAARDEEGGAAAIETLIDSYIAGTNQMFVESGIEPRLRLVFRAETPYTESGDAHVDLGRMWDATDGYMDEIPTARDRVNADFVHLIAVITEICGLGGSYSITGAGCGVGTFAHETGHGMGLSHDRYTCLHSDIGGCDLSGGTYGYGYVDQRNGFRTVMSYGLRCGDAGTSCTDLPRFSNPRQTYNGNPLGVAGSYFSPAADGPSDAVRAANEDRLRAVNLRPILELPRCRALTAHSGNHYVSSDGGTFEFGIDVEGAPCDRLWLWVWDDELHSYGSDAPWVDPRYVGSPWLTGSGTVRFRVEELSGAGSRTISMHFFVGQRVGRSGTYSIRRLRDPVLAVTQLPDLAAAGNAAEATAESRGGVADVSSCCAARPLGGGAGPATVTSTETDVDDLRQWDAVVDAMVRTGDLARIGSVPDSQLPGRLHEYLGQMHDGVPVHGAGLSRQLDNGVTVSIFGTLHDGIDLDVNPAIPAEEAAAFVPGGAVSDHDEPPGLVVLPMPDGSYSLTWRAAMPDAHTYFIDARTGGIAFTINEARSQSEVGSGIGILGDRKKVSATRINETWQALDQLRTGEVLTLDLRRNTARLDHLLRSGRGGQRWTQSDVATDTDNVWEDPAVVDAHVHAGWTYDYFVQAHNYQGLDGNYGRVIGLVNTGASNGCTSDL